jgi:hypothetical protein
LATLEMARKYVARGNPAWYIPQLQFGDDFDCARPIFRDVADE